MITVRDLTKTYGAHRALSGVSFSVDRGELVGFLGPNGAGKSTTMRILCGVLLPNSGEVEVAGHRLPEQAERARARVGFLPEHTPLYRSMRVDRYLEFAARAKGIGRGDRRRALQDVHDRCGLFGYAGKRIEELSKGYRQRVGLAQALLGDPDVLILDEPTSGLDPNEVVRIRELVRDFARQRTVLLSTHVLSEVEELCPRVLILAGGRLVADGSPQDLSGTESRELRVVLTAGEPRSAGQAFDFAGAEEILTAVEGVRLVERLGLDASGRGRFRLVVADPHLTGEAVAAAAVRAGWGLAELSHQVPTLETVFAQRTRAAAKAQAAPNAGSEVTP